VGCVNQLEQPFNYCLIKSPYDSTHFELGSGESQRIINDFYNLSFHLISNTKGITILTLTSNISCTEDKWKKLEITVNVKSCPLGLQLQNKRCDCDKRLLNSSLIIECSISNEIVILTGRKRFIYKDPLLKINLHCPLDYCRKGKKYISHLHLDVQCAHNRRGVLCGGCLANYSVVLNSWKCRQCSHLSSRHNYIWLNVVMALTGVVLVVFLLVMKLTVSSGTIKGLFFYVNIMFFSKLLDNQN